MGFVLALEVLANQRRTIPCRNGNACLRRCIWLLHAQRKVAMNKTFAKNCTLVRKHATHKSALHAISETAHETKLTSM